MGVVYKLQPKIRNFILEKKKKDPNLSCRKFASLVLDKFQLKLSKSSINSVIKSANLSMLVGRRRKKRRGGLLVENLGAFLLKAADCLLGGSYQITEAIKHKLNISNPDLLAKTEYLLYLPLFALCAKAVLKPDFGLWTLIGHKFSPEDISSYLSELQEVKALSLDISQIISDVLQEVGCVKVNLADGTTFYLDGQLHTIWSTPQIPYDFSTSIYNIRSYINKYFQNEGPFVLFMAPGYDTPFKEFFDFILSFDSVERGVAKLTLYGNKFEQIEAILLDPAKKRSFVLGLWPWQYVGYRKVKIMRDFRSFHFVALKEDFYIAEVEVELLQPITNKRVILKGSALKTNLNERIRLIILGNLPRDITAEELVNLYLCHWPNLEETFQDFSRKIELFTYTAASQRVLSTESLNLDKEAPQNISSLFNTYLKALDLYVRWHFLPSGYEDKDFSTTNERFYGLKARFKEEKNNLFLAFKPPSGYSFLKDLEYVLRRINEKEIVFGDGKRLWCRVS